LMVLGELVSAKVEARQRAIKTSFEERVAHYGRDLSLHQKHADFQLPQR
jgi:hypothetical protein